MPQFCTSCGAQIPDAATFCSACGKPAGGTTVNPAYTAGPSSATAAGGLTDNVAGMLAYITIIPAIIFLVMEPYNRKPFVRFHAFQHLFLLVALIVLWVAVFILSAIFAFIPVLGHVVWFLLSMSLSLGVFILWIILLIKAYQGEMWKLPVIGDMAEKQANNI